MDHSTRHQSPVATRCARVTALSITLLVFLVAAMPSMGEAPQGTWMPLAPQPMLEVEVHVRGAGQLQQLESMGLFCPGIGSCCLELSGQQVTALKEAGFEFNVLQRLVKFSLPAPGVAPQGEMSVSQMNSTNYPIPDYSGGLPGTVSSSVNITAAPTGVTVSKVQYQLRVQHEYPGDVELLVSHDFPYKYITVWDRLGGATDGGQDDDSEDDEDIYLHRVEYVAFDNDAVNQTWYLEASDHALWDTGWIDFFELRVYYCVPPAAPTPLSPAAQSRTCDTTPEFSWSAVTGATQYRIQVDDNAGFSSPEYDQTMSTPGFIPGTPLPPGEYHWRVRASDACSSGPWSATTVFDIDSAPPAPALATPPDASHTCDATPDFNWSGVGGATGYRIQIDDNSSFSSPEYNQAMMTPGFTPGLPLSPGQQYWRVRATNVCGGGPWSSVGSFVVDVLPTAPILTAPSDSSHTCDDTPWLDWSTVSGATLYRVQVDDSPSFSSPVVDADVTVSNRDVGPLAPGTYHWRVRASNNCGNSAWSNVWSFVIDDVPGAPLLGLPLNGSHTCDDTPAFEWGAVAGATSYRIQVDNNPAFSSPEVNAVTPTEEPLYTLTTPLAPGTYHWRVRALSDCGPGPWSLSRSFSVDAAPSAPTLRSPPDASHTCDDTPTFEWGGVAGATSYRIQVDNNPAFSSPEVNAVTPTEEPAYTLTTPLAPGTYHWRVRALSDCGPGPWSASRSFSVDAPPDPPVLFSPAGGVHTCDTSPEFSWDVSFGATSYRIQVDNHASFSSPEINATTAELHYTAPSALAPGTYHWRVRAINGCGSGPWSVVWDFVIDAAPGTPSGPSPADGATGVALNADLDWANAAGATSYDVYFGIGTTPPFVTNVVTSQYDPGTLTADTRYHWKIVAKNACGETAGPVWDFTTGAGGTNHAPTNGTITPNSGGQPAGKIVYFTSTYFDPDGNGDLRACRLHIGRVAAPKSLRGNAVLLYQAPTNKLMIRNDRGTRWWGGKLVGSANVIQNSQAKLHCNLTTVTRTGNRIEVRWAVEFKTAFRGRTKMYLKARDKGGLTSALQKKGTWTVQ